MPPEIGARPNAEMKRVVGLPDTRPKLADMATDNVTGSSEQFGQLLRSEIAKWGGKSRNSPISAWIDPARGRRYCVLTPDFLRISSSVA